MHYMILKIKKIVISVPIPPCEEKILLCVLTRMITCIRCIATSMSTLHASQG